MNPVRTLVVCLLMFLTTALAAGAQTWTPLGPAGKGEAGGFFMAPSQPNTLYVLVGNDEGGLYKSTDAGATWTSISPGICDLHVTTVAIHPTLPNTIYTGTASAGVCKSTDGGATWAALTSGLPVDSNSFNKQVSAIAINPTTPATLYAGTASGVYLSSDGGATWALTGTSTASIDSVAIAPSAPATVYASITNGVLKTTNGGTAWTTASTGLSAAGDGFLAVDPTNANVVYLSGKDVFKTSDGGTSWASSSSGLGSPFFFGQIAIDPSNPNTLYIGAAGTCGFCKSTNGGSSWTAVSATGLPGGLGFTNLVETVRIDPVTPTRLFAGTVQGVFRSTDSGATWTAANSGLYNQRISAMGLSGETPASVLIATRALNDGSDMSKLSGGAPPFTSVTSPLVADRSGTLSTIIVDPTNPSTIYVLGGKASGRTCGQVYKTTNGGTSWAAMNSGTTIPASTCGQSLVMDPTTPGTLYLSVCSFTGGTGFVNLYKTTNGASSWTAANSGFGTGCGYGIAVSRLRANVLYASSGGQAFKSTNGGTSWTGTGTLPSGSGSIFGSGATVIDPTDDNIVYTATASGVFGTTNGGTSWTAKRGGWPTRNSVFYSVTALAIDPTTPTTLYASTGTPAPGPVGGFLGSRALGGQIFKSTDSGANWTAVPGTISGAFAYDIQFDGNRAAYAATNNGVFKLAAALPTVAIDKVSLAFGAVSSGAAFTSGTSAQAVRITQTGTGTVTWTASSTSPWLLVSPTSGTGSATLTVSVQFASGLAATQTGNVTLTFTGASNTAGPIGVTLNTITSAAAAVPFGSFDTPADGATGVTGSIAVTGWALDDLEVTRVRILRDPVAGEPAGALVFIGDAVLVDGARPDVQAAYPTLPRASRAGWGYLMLTNFLPSLGNGTFKLYAIADDVDGHSTTLGSKTITCTNNTATEPFGAIDTPLQGQVVTTASLNNFGWVLSRGSRKSDPPEGGTVRVVIDGALGASPGGWTNRADLTGLFPSAQYSGIANALGVASLDMTTLSNAVHTISWLVTDNLGTAAGIGSRYFTVSNGSLMLDPSQGPVTRGRSTVIASNAFMVTPSAGLRAAAVETDPIAGRRGFDPETPLQPYAVQNGRATVQSEELDRIELHLSASDTGTSGETYAGYLRVGDALAPLPAGSSLNAETGEFTWQPGVAFVGSYDLVFARLAGSEPIARRDVRVVLHPKGSNRVGPQTIIDLADGQVLAGWAADLDSQVDSGVDTLHVWAYPVDGGRGGDPVFVGVAEYGGARPDVAAIYGARFGHTGYGIRLDGLARGTYNVAVFAYSTVKNGFVPAKTVRVTVR